MVINDYYNSLGRKDKVNFRKKVLDVTEIEYSTFYFKLRDDSFSKLEREAIMGIIKEDKKNGKKN